MMNKWKNTEMAQGFTLLELLIAVAMLAILAGLAAPSFSDYLATNNVFSHRQDINVAINTARTEALNRNKTVVICPSVNSADCGGSWKDGWIIFLDDGGLGSGVSRDGIRNGTEEVINAFDYNGPNSIKVEDADTDTLITSLSFNERGRPAHLGQATSRRVLITVCDKDNNANLARGLLLIGTGRLIRTQDSNNDGIHESRFVNDSGTVDLNSNLSCS